MLKNFKVIEVISQKSRALLTFYQGRLKFNHHTAAELNFSQYVQLAYDSNQQCFAIIAATKDSENAVQFYNRGGDAKPYPISLYTKAAIETIVELEGLTAEEQEIAEAVGVICRQNNMTLEELKPYYDAEFEHAVTQSVLTTKVMKLIRDNAELE